MHAVNMFDSDYVMICNTKITSVENKLKKIYLSTNILIEFTSTYYNDNNDYFETFFQQYKAISVFKIDELYII